jgi:hypothetical protein
MSKSTLVSNPKALHTDLLGAGESLRRHQKCPPRLEPELVLGGFRSPATDTPQPWWLAGGSHRATHLHAHGHLREAPMTPTSL